MQPSNYIYDGGGVRPAPAVSYPVQANTGRNLLSDNVSGQMAAQPAQQIVATTIQPDESEAFGIYEDACSLAEQPETPSTNAIVPWQESFITPTGWLIRGMDLYDKHNDKEFKFVTNTLLGIVQDIVDIETGEAYVRVGLVVNGEILEFIVPRIVLFDKNKLKNFFTSKGATFSDANAAAYVRFLTDCERLYSGKRPRSKCVGHLGWTDENFDSFMPYDDGDQICLYPPADEEPFMKALMCTKGTLNSWAQQLMPIRESSFGMRALMAAGFASVLVGPLSVQPFTVYIWGASRSGKTAALNAAASIWGNPEGPHPFVSTFNDTPKSLLKHAEALHSLPLCIDELQSKRAYGGQSGKRNSVQDLLYAISLGKGQAALTQDRSQMRSGSWRFLAIATGEIPILGDNTQQGAANRALEIQARPFESEHEARKLRTIINDNYGVAGPVFISGLKAIGLESLKQQWAQFLFENEGRFSGNPHSRNICLLAFADMLASQIVFGISREASLTSAISLGMWIRDHVRGYEDLDTSRSAIQYIYDFIDQNEKSFKANCEGLRLDLPGFIRTHKGRDCFVFHKPVLRDLLVNVDYDVRQTLSRMKEEGLLVTDKGKGNLKELRVGDTKNTYYMVDRDAMESFLHKSRNGLPQVATADETDV